jgi:hypothetical protein
VSAIDGATISRGLVGGGLEDHRPLAGRRDRPGQLLGLVEVLAEGQLQVTIFDLADPAHRLADVPPKKHCDNQDRQRPDQRDE